MFVGYESTIKNMGPDLPNTQKYSQKLLVGPFFCNFWQSWLILTKSYLVVGFLAGCPLFLINYITPQQMWKDFLVRKLPKIGFLVDFSRFLANLPKFGLNLPVIFTNYVFWVVVGYFSTIYLFLERQKWTFSPKKAQKLFGRSIFHSFLENFTIFGKDLLHLLTVNTENHEKLTKRAVFKSFLKKKCMQVHKK